MFGMLARFYPALTSVVSFARTDCGRNHRQGAPFQDSGSKLSNTPTSKYNNLRAFYDGLYIGCR